MNPKTFVILSLLALLTLSQSCCEDNTVKISGNAQIKVKPDIAIITVRVENTADTTSAALVLTNQKISQAIGIFQSNSIPSDDYTTSSFTIRPVYTNVNNERVLTGQTAEQSLRVTIRALTANGQAIGSLIDQLSAAGGYTINGVSFEQSDRRLGVKEARTAAYNSAKAKADEYQKLTGQALRRVLRIQDIGSGSYVPFFADAGGFSARINTVVPVREVTVGASVNVVFSLAP